MLLILEKLIRLRGKTITLITVSLEANDFVHKLVPSPANPDQIPVDNSSVKTTCLKQFENKANHIKET